MQQGATLEPPTFIDLNVLPEELRPPRYPAWYVLGMVAVLAACLLLIPLYRAERAGGTETARLRAELQMAKEELSRVQIDFGRARGLLEELRTTEAAIARLNEERDSVLGEGRALSSDLFAIVAALPPGARLASITAVEGQLSLAGRADETGDVLDYSRVLAGSGRFSAARITSLTVASGQPGQAGVIFTIEVKR